ncbi:ABC transporter permease [Mycolicibacterium frederiksbergense]|uniref:ABC transporter permease n=1 Tax=Mycolicibacterium frederiksbergense TaxID=117567 RepID=A0A6H0RXG6_9MYCO|nr:ABC transporter permease [Mycolicibacterium frederiksbergense]QIV79650.1 ABC transporter permease [Mycolicibacterium frederiksbergense]
MQAKLGMQSVGARTLGAKFTLICAFVLLWQIYATVGGVDSLVFASPVQVFEAMWNGWRTGSLMDATFGTFRYLTIGLVVGVGAAIILTVLATWSKWCGYALSLATSTLTPLPAIAILPLAILWFGIGPLALTIVIANSVVWPVALNISAGFRSVNPTVVMVGRTLGLNRFRLAGDILLPAALPYAFTGLKTGWAFAWRTLIGAELVFGASGQGGGLGFYINNASMFMRVDEVFAGLVTIAIAGVLIEALFKMLERRTLVRWGMSSPA